MGGDREERINQQVSKILMAKGPPPRAHQAGALISAHRSST
jgi:hypothetical protein